MPVRQHKKDDIILKEKRFKAHIYTKERISLSYLNRNTEEINGYLYSQGLYRTHILPEDLPEWYVDGFIYKTSGFISAKGVQHLIYKPCFMNHLFKDDILFISYEKPIISNINSNWPEEYDESLLPIYNNPFMKALNRSITYSSPTIITLSFSANS